MTAAISRSRHPSAGVLVRRLDGELDDAASARLARHLLRCAACHERMSELESDSGEVGRYLRSLEVDTGVDEVRLRRTKAVVRGAEWRHRSRVRARRAWAVAAALGGVLAVSFSAEPVRAWVMRHLPMHVGETEAVAPAVTMPSAVVGSGGSIISFQPAGERFELSVEAVQAGGELLIQVLPIKQATAQVTSGAGESLLILPAGLRIENSAASTASYRVTLPTGVGGVVLTLGNAEPRVIAIPDDASEWRLTVPLGSGDRVVR